jgi:hypothetical protein
LNAAIIQIFNKQSGSVLVTTLLGGFRRNPKPDLAVFY